MRYKKLLLVILAACTLSGCQPKSDPDSPLNLGMAAMEQQKYDAALKSFESSIAEEKDVVLAYRGEGMAYIGLGEYDKAVTAFNSALDHAGEKMVKTIKDIRLYKASAQLKSEDYDGTIETCSQILSADEDGDAYYMRGTCYLQKEDEAKAKADFDKASAMSPEDYDLFWNIYEAYKEKNLSAKGDEYLQKALNIGGEKTEDYYQRGRIYYYLENYEKSKEELIKPVEDKDKASALLLGKVYLKLEDSKLARNIYQQYLNDFGEAPEAYNGIALCDLADNAPDAAIATIQKGLALNGETGKQDLFYNEIVAYERKKDFQTAKEKAEAYIAKYPNDAAGKKEYDFLSTR
ncbi:tetratricopeptide repeat protein [uncultured Robinsoniella sp.]|uniref:tetratricopeptide repeat protein n=1 Tax=uncultured Robinsoniella sp. TaxID=904190 RepID=UPI00374E3AEC